MRSDHGFDPVPLSVLNQAARGEIGPRAPSVLADWREKFDYLYVLGTNVPNPFPAFATKAVVGDHFVLYRIQKRVARQETDRREGQ